MPKTRLAPSTALASYFRTAGKAGEAGYKRRTCLIAARQIHQWFFDQSNNFQSCCSLETGDYPACVPRGDGNHRTPQLFHSLNSKEKQLKRFYSRVICLNYYS